MTNFVSFFFDRSIYPYRPMCTHVTYDYGLHKIKMLYINLIANYQISNFKSCLSSQHNYQTIIKELMLPVVYVQITLLKWRYLTLEITLGYK